jgi:hypothetical protein
MLLMILFLLLAIVLFGLSLTVHFLWIAAVIIAVFWLAGFGFRLGTGGRSRRWYYW